MSLRTSTRRRVCYGFTLVELMVVVVIVGVVGAVALAGISKSRTAQDAAGLARSIHFAMLRARGESVGDGFQRRLSCIASGCTYQVATTSGMAAPAAWSDAGNAVNAGSHGAVWAIASSTNYTSANPTSGPLTSAQTVTFFPDGSATPATVFVCDSNRAHRYKVYVFSATGLTRMVDGW